MVNSQSLFFYGLCRVWSSPCSSTARLQFARAVIVAWWGCLCFSNVHCTSRLWQFSNVSRQVVNWHSPPARSLISRDNVCTTWIFDGPGGWLVPLTQPGLGPRTLWPRWSSSPNLWHLWTYHTDQSALTKMEAGSRNWCVNVWAACMAERLLHNLRIQF